MISKRILIIVISLLAVAAGVKLVQACAGGDDPYDYYPTFFSNTITADPAYKPFYYTSYLTYYDEGSFFGDTPDGEQVPDANIPEWYTYCEKGATTADIDSFVYRFKLEDVKNIYNNITKGDQLKVPAEVENNTFTKWLISTKNDATAAYLLFAKQCEPYTVALEGSYDNASHEWVTPKHDTVAMQQLVEDGITNMKKAANEFLRWRYLYQALRMSYYSGNYAQTSLLYDQWINIKTSPGIIYPRCLGLKAGALYKAGLKADAAYLYSRAFDLSDEMKRKSYISFNWSVSDTLTDVFNLCKNDHERAVIYIMDGLYEHGGQEEEGYKLMEKAYQLDPSIKGLNVVMTREINKAEERYLQKDLTYRRNLRPGVWDFYNTDNNADKDWIKTKNSYIAYLGKLNTLAQNIADQKKNGHVAFWHLTSAYLYFLQNNYDGCKQFLAKAEGDDMAPAERDQHDIINVLYSIRKDGSITSITESNILPTLQKVEKGGNDKLYRDLLSAVLTAAYMEQHDTVKALLCQARINKNDKGGYTVFDDFTDMPGQLLENMSIDKLHETQAFLKSGATTAFNKWLLKGSGYTADMLIDLEATKYIREYKFDKAIAVLQKMTPAAQNNTQLPDFLVSHLQDSQDLNKSDTANMYSKLQFAQKMLLLQQTLANDPEDSRTAYQYANGLYSMTYYGKSHHAYDYYRSSVDGDAYFATNDRAKLSPAARNYYSADSARKYYLVAFENSGDAEVKARCLFLAAKCWQKNTPVPPGDQGNAYTYNDDGKYYKNALTNPYFKQLNDKYTKTKFYTSAVSTCSYFKDYVKKNKK